MATSKGKAGMVLSRGKGGRRQLRRARNAFTEAKQDRFFEALAESCNVSAACRAARVSSSCVYEHRRESAAFRARWAEVLRDSYARLELMMVERMMNGTVKTVTRADGSVETIHQYSDSVALQLLRLHRQTAAEAAIEYEPEEADEARARIADKLERFKARLEREAAEKGDGNGDTHLCVPGTQRCVSPGEREAAEKGEGAGTVADGDSPRRGNGDSDR